MKNPLTNFLAAIGVIGTSILLSGFITLPLSVYIIRDIAQLYKADMVLSISKEAMYGLMLIFGIITVKFKRKKKEKEEKEVSDMFIEMIGGFIEAILFLLIAWCIAYLVHGINF